MGSLVLPVAIGAAAVGGWFLPYTLILLATRPARPDPAPATQDLPGSEPPAVVSLLAGNWELTEDAAESTFIDLAARKYLEFRQPGNDPLRPAGFGWLVTFVVLSGFANRPHGERDTDAGRAVAARWLGVKAWLRNTEAFADLPPAAVAVWDRYLSYGDALGTTRVASAVIDLGMGNRKRVWSSYGGTWHRVRVRYPTFWPRYGKTAPRLIGRGLFAAGLGVLVLYA